MVAAHILTERPFLVYPNLHDGLTETRCLPMWRVIGVGNRAPGLSLADPMELAVCRFAE